MFSEKNDRQKSVRTGFILKITLILTIIISNVTLALNSFPQLFFQSEWPGSADQIVVFLLNLREINKHSAQYFSFSTYFTDFDNTVSSWNYLGEEDLLELVDLMSLDNKLTVEKFYSLLNRQGNYISWLLTAANKPARLRLEEKYINKQDLDLLKEESLYISLIPREISPETGEILTEIEFSFLGDGFKKQGEGRVETTLWLNNNSLKNVAVVSRRLRTDHGEEERYYILQVAAALISAAEYAELNGGLVGVGDIAAFNELLAGEVSYSRPVTRQLTLRWDEKGPGIEFRQDKERFNYTAKLNIFTVSNNELDYMLNFNYYLHNDENLALSLQLANEIGMNPGKQNLSVFRLGFTDQLDWTNRLSIALSYYPVKVSQKEGLTDLWQLSCLYKQELWEIGYRGEFAGKDSVQELALSYYLEEEKGRAIKIGVNYVQETVFLLAYTFNL